MFDLCQCLSLNFKFDLLDFWLQETNLCASSTKALQDCVHQGSHSTHTDCSSHPCSASRWTEDSYLRLGQETWRATGYCYPNTSSYSTVQTWSILHQIQDTGMIRLYNMYVYWILNDGFDWFAETRRISGCQSSTRIRTSTKQWIWTAINRQRRSLLSYVIILCSRLLNYYNHTLQSIDKINSWKANRFHCI